ncbi:MAG TPA: hypothetical protein VHE99_07235 [Gammaproteobacteria bacterium]|nr:hypothetical protein [Gammaproteobacteria bacterium]
MADIKSENPAPLNQDSELQEPLIPDSPNEEVSFWAGLRTDILSSLKVVSIPSVITNSIWRGLNLAGVAADGGVLATSYQIAMPVFITCFSVDLLRRAIEKSMENNITVKEAFSRLEKEDFIGAAKLALKFYGGVVGWTAGYKYLGAVLQKTGLMDVLANALGAAFGSAGGLFSICEAIEFAEVKAKKKDSMDHQASWGVAFRGAVEGAIWSVMGDKNLHQMLSSKNISDWLAKTIDSFAVGIPSGIGFGIASLGTYPCSRIYNFFASKKESKPNPLPVDTQENDLRSDSILPPGVTEEDKGLVNVVTDPSPPLAHTKP